MMQLSLRDNAGRLPLSGMTGAQLDQLRQARTVESVVAEDGWNLTTTDGDIPEDVVASYISPNAPNHWGVPALMGRWLIPADAPAGSGPRARRRARLPVLAAVLLGRSGCGRPHDPTRAQGLSDRRRDAAALPLARSGHLHAAQGQARSQHLLRRTSNSVPVCPTAEANAELQPVLQEFAKQAPERYPDSFRVNLRSIVEFFARPMGPRLFLLLGAVTSLLLIGCANVSILLLVRGAHRQQELAVRAALGAGRMRIVRQLLTEALAIAAAGALLGVLIAWKGLALIVAWIPTNSFAAESVIEMNLPVFSSASARRRDRDRVWRLAGAAAVTSGSGAGSAGQYSARDWQRAGGAGASRDGWGAGRADAPDADRGRRRGQGIPAAGECRPRVRPALHHVGAHPRP